MDRSELTAAISEALRDLVRKELRYTQAGIEKHIKNATQNAVQSCIGDNTYLWILKRLEVLETMCLEHRADWAEERLRALEAQMKDVKDYVDGKRPKADCRGDAEDQLSRCDIQKPKHPLTEADLCQVRLDLDQGGQGTHTYTDRATQAAILRRVDAGRADQEGPPEGHK